MGFEDFKLKYQKKEVLEELNEAPKTPLVSVLVQTYRHVDYIKMCLDSILMQKTNFEFEIILGEDASDDGTREICLNYAKHHPNKIRLFLHHRENNIQIGGAPSGRFIFLYNLISARGKYIALCEGDDYWTDPLKLQKQVDFLEENMDYVLVGTYANVHKGNKIQIPNKIEFRSFNFYDIANNFSIPTLTYCFRNQYDFKNFNYPVGDMGLSFEVSKYGGKMGKLPFVSGVYNYHGGGVNSGKSRFDNIKLQFRTLYLMGKNTDDYYFKILMRWCFLKVGTKELKGILLLRHRNFKFFFHSLIYLFKI